MPAIPNTAQWRAHPQRAKKYLYIDNPPVVFACRATGDITFPLSQFTYNTVTVGAYTDVEVWQQVNFGTGAGKSDLGTGIVHKLPTSGIMYIARTSRGLFDGEANISAGSYITVIDHFPVRSTAPFIDESGTTYKAGDHSFADYGLHLAPIVNIDAGMGWADLVDGAGYVTLDLDSAGSFSPQGADIASSVWDIKDGTILSGDNISRTLHAKWPAGRRWISLRLIDEHGSVSIRKYLIVGCDPNGVCAPIRKFEITSHKLLPQGTDIGFTIRQDLPENSYPDGCAVIFFEHERSGTYRGSQGGPTGKEHVKFAGYHHSTSHKPNASLEHGIVKDMAFACLDVAGRLKILPAFPTVVQNVETPIAWEQMFEPDMDKYPALHWLTDTTASGVADFYISGFGWRYPFVVLDSPGESAYDQIDQRAKAFQCLFVADPWGRFYIRGNPQRQITTTQMAESGRYPGYLVLETRTDEVIVDLVESDFNSPSYTRASAPNQHWLRGAALLTSGETIDLIDLDQAVLCISPGPTPGQGLSEGQQSEVLVQSQDELDAVFGHWYAESNIKLGRITITLLHCNSPELLSPALLEWVTFTTNKLTDRRGVAFTAHRFLPIEVDIQHNKDNGTKQVIITLAPEVIGVPATAVPVDTSNTLPVEADNPIDYYPDPLPLDGGVSSYDLYKNTKVITAVNSDGYAYQTKSFGTLVSAGGPKWTRVSLGVSGTPVQFVPYAYSSLYLKTGARVDGWVITTTGIYFVTDLTGTPAATLQKSFRGTASKRSADASFGAAGYCVVLSAYSDGVYETYTTNASTWSSETLVGSATAAEFAPGVFESSHSPGLVYGGAMYSSGNKAFRATGGGASVSQISSPKISSNIDLPGDIHVPYDNNTGDTLAYFGSSRPETTVSTEIGFDWTAEWDFRLDPYTSDGWSDYAVPEGCAFGYTPGRGYGTVTGGTDVHRASPPWSGASASQHGGSVTGYNLRVTLEESAPTENSNVYSDSLIWVTGGLGAVHDPYWATAGPGTPPIIYPSAGGFPCNNLIFCYFLSSNQQPLYIRKIRYSGHGSYPFTIGTLLRGLNKAAGTVLTDVSPSPNYGPWKSRGQIVSSPLNKDFLVTVAGIEDQSLAGIWVSTASGTPSWRSLVPAAAPGSRYERVAISGDGKNAIYLLGTGGKLGLSLDAHVVIDQSGNIPSDFGSAGEFIGLCGG